LALASTILLLVLSIFVIVVNTTTKSISQNADRLIKELEEYTKDEEKDS
jgi:predicted PurR-regulated permease PerM